MTTYTLTIAVSDATAARLAALSDRLDTLPAERMEAAALAFVEEVEAAEAGDNAYEFDPVKYQPNAFELEAIGRGLASGETGELIDGKTAIAQMREQLRREFPAK